jgi:caffeoyl-CoA O-methyltransferase
LDHTSGATVILDDAVSDYLTDLAVAGHHDQVLGEMESRAAEHGFPIVGRAVGRFLETAARMVGATRVCELGSGYGYSAYWFARAVGSDGEVVCTDGSADNATLAENYLRRAGLWEPITWHTGDALEGLAATEGEFDVIYCDVDKGGYPDCWEAARQRIRVGGIWLCDNVLWDGRVVTGEDREGLPAGWTAAIQQMNRAVADDPDWISTIAPIRDGVLLAVRIR